MGDWEISHKLSPRKTSVVLSQCSRILGGRGRWITSGQEFENSLANMGSGRHRDLALLKSGTGCAPIPGAASYGPLKSYRQRQERDGERHRKSGRCKMGSGAVAHTYNPSTLGGQEAVQNRSTFSINQNQSEPVWVKMDSVISIQKISQAWWRMAVIPATQEAEAGESLEPRRQRLQLGDSQQRSHTGHQRDSFGRHGCFASALVRHFSVRSIRDWLGWSHPHKENSNWKR
ncbi:hypothetical protein AAY473_006001 [Plecturocebus cupreus]